MFNLLKKLVLLRAEVVQLREENATLEARLQGRINDEHAAKRKAAVELQVQIDEFERFCIVGGSFGYLDVEFVVTQNDGHNIMCDYFNNATGRIDVKVFSHARLPILFLQSEKIS